MDSCLNCGKPLNKGRVYWKRFCSARCRMVGWALKQKEAQTKGVDYGVSQGAAQGDKTVSENPQGDTIVP